VAEELLHQGQNLSWPMNQANLDSKAATTLLEIMEKLNHEEKITLYFQRMIQEW